MTLRRSLFWSLSQQFGMMVLQITNMVVIARLLTPEEIGVFIIALSIVTILQALREMGLTNYLIHTRRVEDSTIRAIFGMSITLCAVLGAGLWLLRHPLETWMGTPGLAAVLAPVVLVILIFPVEQPAMALIRREMRFEALHHITIASKLIAVSTSIGLALAGFSTMALVWGMLAEAVVRMVLLAWAEPRHLRLGPSLRGWGPLLSFGAWTTGASIAGQATPESSKLLVGAILGAGPTALFDRAIRIPAMIRMALFMPLGRVLLSSFSEDLRQGRDIGAKAERLTTVMSGIVWPSFAVLAVLSEEVVLLMLGPQWTASAQILPWLLLAQSVLALLPQPDQILVPFGRVRRLFALRLFQLAVSLATSVIALQWGLEVFAMTRTIESSVLIIVAWLAISPYIGVGIGRLMRSHLRSLMVAAVTVLPVAAWKYAGLGDGSYAVLIGLMILATLLGLAAMIVLRHPLGEEMLRARAWLARRRARS